MSAGEAVRIIVDCDTIATSGVVGSGLPEARAVALEARFLESGMRRRLTLVHAAGPGDGADRRIFLEGRIDLRRASRLTLADRVRYDAGENILFLNFECLTLDTDTDADVDVLALEAVLERRITAIGHRVRVIVNDDNFGLARAAAETSGAVVAHNQERYFLSSSRHSSSAFFRRQLAGHLAPARLERTVYRDPQGAKNGLRRRPARTPAPDPPCATAHPHPRSRSWTPSCHMSFSPAAVLSRRDEVAPTPGWSWTPAPWPTC
jgi:hypothetical protein